MARPSWSNPSTASGSATSSLVWPHTAESGKDIRVIIAGVTNGWATSTCTFGGVAGRQLEQFTGSFLTFHSISVYIFENPTPGTANIEFIADGVNSALAAGAFNIVDGAPTSVLMGVFDSAATATPLTRQAYGWDPDGLLIAFAWGQSNLLPTTITQGVNIASVGGLTINAIDATDADGQDVTFTKGGGGVAVCDGGAFMIPPAVQSTTSGTFQPVPTGSMDMSNVAPGGTAFAGLPYGTAYIDGRLGNIINSPGTWRSWAINSNRAPGAGNEVTVEIYRGGGDGSLAAQPTGITLTISDTDTTSPLGAGDGIDFANYRYECLSLRLINSGAGTLPADFAVRAFFIRECGIANEHICGGGIQTLGSGSVGTEVDRAVLHPGLLSWGSFSLHEKSLQGIAGNYTEYVASYQEQTTLDIDFYYKLNGTLQDGSGGTVDTLSTLNPNSLGRALARWRGTLPAAPGDFVANTEILRTPTGFWLRQAVNSVFVPSTPGQFQISGHWQSAFSVGAVAYNAVFDSSGTQTGTVEAGNTADEAKLLMIVPPLTAVGSSFLIQGLIDAINTAPGATSTERQDLRINQANSGTFIELTGVGSGPGITTGTVGASHSLVEGENFDTLWTPTNAPAADFQFWSLPGLLLAPAEGEIIIIKDAGGIAGPLFNFLAGGGLSPTTFQLEDGQSQSFPNLVPGSGYSVEEVAPFPVGWSLGSIAVSNGSPNTNILVGPGETVTVTFVNETCPGDATGQRTDGLRYRPVVVAGSVLTLNGEVLTLNGDPITINDCNGPGQRSGSRIGR